MHAPLSAKSYQLKAGFTLIELMIYAGLTSIMIGLFGGILITMTRIQGSQSSSSSVIGELNFLMNTIKRDVHSATSFIVAVPERLELTINASTTPPTTKFINWLSDPKKLVVIENGPSGSSTSQLSSTKIIIEEVVFTQARSGNSAAVDISITASASTTNPQQQLTRTIRSTAALFVQDQ